MAIFLDTGFLVALCHKDDKFHKQAELILNKLGTGQYGLIYSSSFIIDEAATLILFRTNNNQDTIQEFFSYFFGNEPFIELLPWSIEIEQDTILAFQKFNQKAKNKKEWLSFTDVSNIVFCQNYKIDNIATFDSHFKGFLTEIN